MAAIAFKPGDRLFLDSNVLIYWVEDAEPYAEILSPVFDAAARGEITLVVSALSLLETLVEPLRRGERDKVERFRRTIRGSRCIECRPMSDDVLEKAASLRAEGRLRTPDAILAATCLLAECDAFLTNDDRLKDIAGLGAILLSECVAPP